MTVLQLQNINKIYQAGKENEVHALKNVNVSFSTNEIVAIVGVSGSGKSTLLNILGQMDVPTSGSLLYRGSKADFTKSKSAAFRNKALGFIPQEIGLLSNETVFDNVCIPLAFNKNIKLNQVKGLVEKALTEVGMEKFTKRKVSTLSGGQKQRIAIARAIVNQPDLILADEPTGALDSATAQDILTVFKKLKNEDRTIIIVTHDMSIADNCDRIIKISDGKIVT